MTTPSWSQERVKMVSFGLVCLIVLILIVIVIFYAGILLDFINPSALQVQLLGVHITLFGVIVLLAFEGSSGYGFTIGLIGLFTGMFGSFREPQRA
ncbi:membrane-bound ClpP family serine protease [Paenibacillus sp. V4I3]|nr:membrane-bound ClpP family serine protease [Paenibacillus sp. V4I3]